MVKPIVSQQVEKMKTKSKVSQRVEVDSTPRCPVGSVSSGIPSVVTPGGDRVANMDTEQVEKIVLMQLGNQRESAKVG